MKIFMQLELSSKKDIKESHKIEMCFTGCN
jgi:hypothetical protein